MVNSVYLEEYQGQTLCTDIVGRAVIRDNDMTLRFDTALRRLFTRRTQLESKSVFACLMFDLALWLTDAVDCLGYPRHQHRQ